MARRNNKKISKAHHDSMLVEESNQIRKKRSRASRRAKAAERDKIETVLCNAFNSGFAVGDGPKGAVPHVGAPISPTKDVKMKTSSRSKKGRIKKNKKAARRLQKVRQRQADRSAMTM